MLPVWVSAVWLYHVITFQRDWCALEATGVALLQVFKEKKIRCIPCVELEVSIKNMFPNKKISNNWDSWSVYCAGRQVTRLLLESICSASW